MKVLVLNAGSSSLKLAVVEDGVVLQHEQVEHWDGRDLEAAHALAGSVGGIDAVGHRVVHGGPRLVEPTVVDDEVMGYLETTADLAPLHNPAALAGVRGMRRDLPDVPQVVCVDTAFHAGLPAAARTYALPREWNQAWDLRRYGFHGLSHAHAVRRGCEVAGLGPGARTVSCHLGSGASLAAVVDGRSVDTTMGFTPLEGLVMGTRSGDVDPGLLLWLLREHVGVQDLDDALEHRSGLLGLAGSSDLREVLDARSAGEEDADLAYRVLVHRLRREIGAMSASAGGLDLLVFTGGMGEHVPELRSDACDALGYLGVGIDQDANRDATGDTDISAPTASTRTVVVTAGEELEVARLVTTCSAAALQRPAGRSSQAGATARATQDAP